MPSKPRIRIAPSTKGYKRRHYFEWVKNGAPQDLTGLTVIWRAKKPGVSTYVTWTATQLNQTTYPGQFYTEIGASDMDTVSTDTDRWLLDVYVDSEPLDGLYFDFDCYLKETEAP